MNSDVFVCCTASSSMRVIAISASCFASLYAHTHAHALSSQKGGARLHTHTHFTTHFSPFSNVRLRTHAHTVSQSGALQRWLLGQQLTILRMALRTSEMGTLICTQFTACSLSAFTKLEALSHTHTYNALYYFSW